MKKVLFIIVCAVLLVFAVSSCEKTEIENDEISIDKEEVEEGDI